MSTMDRLRRIPGPLVFLTGPTYIDVAGSPYTMFRLGLSYMLVALAVWWRRERVAWASWSPDHVPARPAEETECVRVKVQKWSDEVFK